MSADARSGTPRRAGPQRPLLRLGLALAVCAGALSFVGGAFAYKKELTASGQATAQRDLLQRADLSNAVSWTGGAIMPDDSALSCAGYHPSTTGLVKTGEAADRFSAPGLAIGTQVDVLASSSMVGVDMRRSFVPGLIPCLRASLTHSKVTVLSVTRLPFPMLARYVDAYRVVYELSSGGKKLHLAFDTIFLSGGRTEITLTVIANLPTDEATGEADVSRLELAAAGILVKRALVTPPSTATTPKLPVA